jgi:hypothetical protein
LFDLGRVIAPRESNKSPVRCPFGQLCFESAARLAHALAMQEQPPDWYWDLTQATWVHCEHDERPDEDEPAEMEQTSEPN